MRKKKKKNEEIEAKPVRALCITPIYLFFCETISNELLEMWVKSVSA